MPRAPQGMGPTATAPRTGPPDGGPVRSTRPTAPGIVDDLLTRARALGASDLHLDPTERGVRVQARCDGVLQQLETLDADLGPRIVGRLKALSGLLAYRCDVPQEGRIPADLGQGGECRVATFPTLLGERVTLRFDVPNEVLRSISDLGMDPEVERELRLAWRQSEGVVLVTGPSGSGKTTTLYACLREALSQPVPRTVLTIEDPIERRVAEVTQTQLNAAAGLTYALALRSLLRQDPDVILVGEVRDPETASMVLEAGLTGHLVGSTIHGGTCAQVFVRLLEMGMEPFVLTTAVRGVLAQRLVRRLASDGTFSGRTVVTEWLPMDAHLRRVILSRGDAEAIEEARRQSGRPGLRDDGDRLVRAGRTSRAEIERVLGTP